jgi:hypothetical protein
LPQKIPLNNAKRAASKSGEYMNIKEISIPNDPSKIKIFDFGLGEPSVCFTGGIHGNEATGI